LSFRNISGTLNANRYRPVNDYTNSADQASEYFLVGTFNGSGAYQEEFDRNGQKLVIDGGVANFTAGDFRISQRFPSRQIGSLGRKRGCAKKKVSTDAGTWPKPCARAGRSLGPCEEWIMWSC